MLTRSARAACMLGCPPRRDGPSQLVKLEDERVWEFDDPDRLAEVVQILAEELGADTVTPGVNCRGIFPSARRPPLPTGGLLHACCVSVRA